MKGFSYQLYSSRNYPPLERTFAMLHEQGYAMVEGYDALFATPGAAEELHAALDATGLRMASGHFGFDMLRESPAGVLAIARVLEMHSVYVPMLPEARRPVDAAGWAAFARDLAEAGKPLADAGLTFGWHNHAFEFTDLGGTTPMALILEHAPGLAWEFDVAWAVRGGADPLAWIEAHGPRIHAAHVKDIAAPGEAEEEDGWADPGHGTLDWPRLYAALRKAGCRLFVAEHDNPADDRRFAARAIDTLRRLEDG